MATLNENADQEINVSEKTGICTQTISSKLDQNWLRFKNVINK